MSLVDVGWWPVQATHLDHRSMPTSGKWWRLSPLMVSWLRLLPDAGKLRGSIVLARRPTASLLVSSLLANETFLRSIFLP